MKQNGTSEPATNWTEDKDLAWKVDTLVDVLARPIYSLRMARGMMHSRNPTQLKSAMTRATNARKEIDKIVRHYVEATTPIGREHLPVEVVGALTLGIGISYEDHPLDPLKVKLYYPQGQAPPPSTAARLRAVVARIGLINTDVDKPSAQKDWDDLVWGCRELKAIAQEIEDEEAQQEAGDSGNPAR